MLQTKPNLSLDSPQRRYSRQWTIQTRYNEYYLNRYICLLEEQEADCVPLNSELKAQEHAQLLVFSLWTVETGVSARLMPDEEKSTLLEVFGWLPVTIQLRRGSIYTDFRQCPKDIVNLTSRTPLQPSDLKSFWHFINAQLAYAPSALYDPAKIGLLSLCEESARSEPHWKSFLAHIGF